VKLRIIRTEPCVTHYESRKYAKVEVDFSGCGELNTLESRRRAVSFFVIDVIGRSPAWGKLLKSKVGPMAWKRIDAFLSGQRERIPLIIVNTLYPHLMSFYVGETLWRFPGERELVKDFIPELLGLLPSHERAK